jgi:hypothetical protein
MKRIKYCVMLLQASELVGRCPTPDPFISKSFVRVVADTDGPPTCLTGATDALKFAEVVAISDSYEEIIGVGHNFFSWHGEVVAHMLNRNDFY